jgi:hypothetical protein
MGAHACRRIAPRDRELSIPSLSYGDQRRFVVARLRRVADCGPQSFELNPAERVSAENDCQPEQDDCDRHERRAGDVSEQDEENRDDGEDCSDVVIHSFPIVGLPRVPRKHYLKQDS